MSRTITAMYDSRSEAEAAREQLRSAIGVDARIVDQSSSGGSMSSSGGMSGSTSSASTGSYNSAANSYDPSGSSSSSSSGGGRGFWAELKDVFMSDEDRHSYEEGIRRGGFLLTAYVPEEQADRACDILERSSSVDFNSREQQWRSEGWQGYQGQRSTGLGAQSAVGTSGAMGATSDRANLTDEERIPIVEEQLRVGKREVNRGTARVRSYVEEVPVEETVSLREEHVDIERRPVNQPVSAADNNALFQERTIEVTEMGEEAVVGKEARVKEEVVVHKTATERTEQVHDTVRRTNVDVDKDATTDTDRGTFGNDRDR